MMQDRTELAPVLAALGHPLRLPLLHAMLEGAASTQALQALPAFATSGQLYRRLRDVEAAVPGKRVAPLLAILSAAQG
jgi:hypothetical protein